uniref:START domain-containing protein n=1 Tax=Macrostomum lignano TaxID=282301 RepID=A0A1I8JRH3_9PLAT
YRKPAYGAVQPQRAGTQKQSTETRGGRAGGAAVASLSAGAPAANDANADLMENIAELDSLLIRTARRSCQKTRRVDGSIESAAAEMLRSFRLLNSEKATERQLRHPACTGAASFVVILRDSQIAALTAPQMQEAARGAPRLWSLNRIVREHCPPSKSLLTLVHAEGIPSAEVGAGELSSSTSTNSVQARLKDQRKRSSSTSSSTVVCGVAAHEFPSAGGRARSAALKSRPCDANRTRLDFANCQPRTIWRNCVKLYLRELPSVSYSAACRQTLMDIFTYVKSEDARLLAMQASMLLLPDENFVKYSKALLYFTQRFSPTAAETSQMARRTLARSAWRPRPCYLYHHEPLPGVGHWRSRRKCREKIETARQPSDSIHSKPQSKQSKQLEQETQLHQSKHPPLSLDSVAPRDSSGRRHCFAFADNHAQLLARECGETAAAAGKWRQFSLRSGVETFSRSVADGHPLRMWKAVMGIDADPGDVLNKIIAERPSWDPDILSAHTVEAIDDSAEVVRFGVASPPAQPAREACLLRTWRSDSASSHRLHSVSVQLQPSHQTVQIHVLNEDWLLERVPGAGRSSSPRCRVTLLSRVDLRGRSIDCTTASGATASPGL